MDKLKWETVTYTIAELKPAGGVVTQRDVLEKYKAEHPDEEVKTFSGFKYDHQSKTVSLRIAIADLTIVVDSGTVAKIEPKLLQSERDELVALKEKYDKLQQELNKTGLALLDAVKEVEGLKMKYDALEKEKETLHEGYDRVVVGAHEDDKEFHELEVRYSALVEAVGKDAQKFSAMLVENDNLKEENDRLTLQLAEIDEDSADLVEAKKAIVEDDSIGLDEVEEAVENKEPVTDTEGGEDE